MKTKFNIGLIQAELVWENPAKNMNILGRMLDSLPANTDLAIFPETFSTGFSMHADKCASERGDEVHQWMEREAHERNMHLSGSLIVREGERIYNRLYWVSPSGIEGQYDKRHLFRMGREDQYFTEGRERLVFALNEIRLCPQICYDLRFPVFSRNRNDYDVLFYAANWPAPRQQVWETLLKARAIENQAWVIGVNRTGVDGEGVDHLGGSCIVNPKGEVEDVLDRRPGILNCSIDIKKIREFREKFPVWKDADNFSIEY